MFSDEIRKEHDKAILSLLQQTAVSLGNSLGTYWPSADRNDPGERNVSLHFAHAMLSSHFSTFAEAHHPDRDAIQLPDGRDRARAIDILGIAPDNSWYIACEFKRLFSGGNVASVVKDVARLAAFWPRTAYRLEEYGHQYEAASRLCAGGYGLVGGIHWLSRQSSNVLDVWNDPDRHTTNSEYGVLSAALKRAGATLAEPLHAIPFPKGNYFLLAAYFPIARSVPGIQTQDASKPG